MHETNETPSRPARRARIFATLILVLCVPLIQQCGSGTVDPTARFSRTQLEQDFRQLRRLIYDGHPMTFTDRHVLDAAFDTQFGLLRDSMTILEFYRIAAPAVSAVRCGHTELYLPDPVQGYIRDTLFILPSDAAAEELAPGDVITAINGLQKVRVITYRHNSGV